MLSSNLVTSLIKGFSGNSSKGYSTYEDMRDAWHHACLQGTVRGSLHQDSLLKIIVPRTECQKRIAAFYRKEGILRRQAAAAAAAAADATTADTGDNATPTGGPAAPGTAAPAPPSHLPPGNNLHGLDDIPEPPGMTSVPSTPGDPPAWVVIRGVRPGVYYTRYALSRC